MLQHYLYYLLIVVVVLVGVVGLGVGVGWYTSGHVLRQSVLFGVAWVLRRVSNNDEGNAAEYDEDAQCVVARHVWLKRPATGVANASSNNNNNGEYVYVDELKVSIPSWKEPVKVVVHGVKICVRQHWRNGSRVADQRAEDAGLAHKMVERERDALNLIDEILWGVENTSSGSAKRRIPLIGGMMERVTNSMVYRIAQFVIQSVHLELKNTEMYYMQQGEPGPRSALCKYSGRDAVHIKVRDACVGPAIGPERVARMDAGGETYSTWLEMLKFMSRVMLGKESGEGEMMTVAGTSLVISGVSLDVMTYPETWQNGRQKGGYQAGSIGVFSFPKYSKVLHSSERKQLDRLKNTTAYAFLQGENGDMMSLATEEVHRLIDQWEVALRIQVIPPGLAPLHGNISHHTCDRPRSVLDASSLHGDDVHDLESSDDTDIDDEDGDSFVASEVNESTTTAPTVVRYSRGHTCTISVDIDFKALLLNSNVASLGIVERLHGRHALIQKFDAHWSRRPDVPIFSHENTWWKHAGNAVLKEVQSRVRRQVHLTAMGDRRASRLTYQPLYVSKYSRNPMFRDPNRRWYQRNTVVAVDEVSIKDLQKFEEMLTFEEIAHFRLMAAAQYNHVLAAHPALMQFTATKIDYIISQMSLGNSCDRDALLHLDNITPPDPMFEVAISAACPKISLSLDTRRHFSDKLHESIPYYVCSMKHLNVAWEMGGATHITVRTFEAGSCEAPTSPVTFTTIASPSLLCDRVCKAADFTRYTVYGSVKVGSMLSSDDCFVNINIQPRIGQGGVIVSPDLEGEDHISESIKGWRSSGLNVEVQIAAIGCRISELQDKDDYTRVLTSLIDMYKASDTYIQSWFKDGEVFKVGSNQYEPLDSQVLSVKDMLEEACAKSSTPTANIKDLSTVSLDIKCPGIAFQIPYIYTFGLSHKAAQHFSSGKRESGDSHSVPKTNRKMKTLLPEDFTDTQYMLTIVLQNLRFSMSHEHIDKFLDKGAIRRTEASGLLDIFSYLSEEERKSITMKLAPSKFVYDEVTREFKQVASGVRQFRRNLRELELTSMAKVWAYPEDMPLILKGASNRASSRGFLDQLNQSTSKRSLSADESEFTGKRSMSVSLLEKSRYPIPIVPFIKSFGMMGCLANRISGMPQVPGESSNSAGLFVRGIQTWFSPVQLSHISCISSTLKGKLKQAGDVLSKEDESTKDTKSSAKNIHEGDKLRIFQLKVHVQEISMMWMIGTWAVKGKQGGRHLKTWGLTVKKSDPAFLWGQWLAPLYSVSISGLKLGLRQAGSQPLALKCTVRGIIARDLQLSELARHAYVLRPLPARAKRIFDSLVRVRRQVLGVREPSEITSCWRRAAAMITLRRAVDIDIWEPIKQLPSFDDFDLDTAGSQLQIEYCIVPSSDNHRSGHLSIDVGQMLGYIRMKKNASLASFINQVSYINVVPDQPVKESKHSGYQEALKVNVNMVGLDFTGRFQSEDLFSLRLQQGYLALDKKRVTMYSNPKDIRMHMSAKVENLLLYDLRASDEHRLVLSPSNDAQSCAVELQLTSKVDGKQFAPSLVVDVTNPRIVLLFRFIKDALEGIDIISNSLNQSDSNTKKNTSIENAHDEKATEFVMNISDIDLVLPTAQSTRSVLNVSIKDFVLSLPGSALPDAILDDAGMPEIGSIVQESLVCSTTYLYSNFSRDRAKTATRRKERVEKIEDVGIVNNKHADSVVDEREVANDEKKDTSMPGRRKSTRMNRAKEKRKNMSGVLLFEDQYGMKLRKKSNVGVLKVPENSMDGQIDSYDDNILSRPAAAVNKVGQAIRELVGHKPDFDTSKTIANDLSDQKADVENGEEEDIASDEGGGVSESVPEAHLAICVREMNIVSGKLVAMPKTKLSDDKKEPHALYRAGTTYAHQNFRFFEVLRMDEFMEPMNLSLVMFERNEHQQLHISMTDFRLVLSTPVYTTIMDFVSGNLGDFMSDPDGPGMVRFKEIRYNEGMRFGPLNEANATFRFTLATPGIDCIMAAHPREWMINEPVYAFTRHEESDKLLPFFDIRLANMIMNVVNMDSGDTYMNFCSTRVDMNDLRLGYRLNKLSNDIASRGGGSSFQASTSDSVSLEPAQTSFSVARRLSDYSHKHGMSVEDLKQEKYVTNHIQGLSPDMCSVNHVVPVIEFTSIPAMKSILGEEAACYRLLTTDVKQHERPSIEMIQGANNNIRLEAGVGILSDSTMAVEIALSGGLLQWPYFHDTSLISSIVNIFNTGTAEERENDDHVKKSENMPDITPWMYINVLITDTELFVPVIDVKVAQKMISQLWKPSGEDRRNEFEKVADLILATMLVHSSTDSDGVLSVEDRGLSLDASLLRFCYASGGDGEILMKTDFTDVALLLRDPDARVHTVLQPLSASLTLKMQQPEAAERQELRRLNNAASVIQRHWRAYYLVHKVKEKLEEMRVDDAEDADEVNFGIVDQWKLIEKLALDVATPSTKELLEDYYAGKGEKGAFSHLEYKSLSVQTIAIQIGVFTCRMAFSHVGFWKSTVDIYNAMIAPQKASPVVADSLIEPAFRPHGLKISASFERLALVLCNDKPETFGAPDVLHFSISDGEATLDMASLLPDRPPNAVGHVSMTVFSNFLNSGSSKWEPLISPWAVRAEFIDSNGSGFASDRQLSCYVSSEHLLEITFNPASLMSIGDALAFTNSFSEPRTRSKGYQTDGTAVEEFQSNVKAVSLKGMSSRAPQKYLIQNQSGLKFYYWTEETSKAGRKKSLVVGLDPDASETLKVVPCNKKLTILNFNSSATGTERLGAVINLHFEGNWMPIHDVPINVVGKYKYLMSSPADNTVVPVLVDVILVGRTKIITVHSGIWVENSIEIPVSFKLHVPTTSLVPPGISRGAQRCDSIESNMRIGPLNPGEGTYLPLVASLGGLLFLHPNGYEEATRDVIRLSVNVEDLVNQQGYIVCDPPDLPGVEEKPLHVTMEVIPSRVLSEFQTFKHLEVVAPGTLQRATSPLEVTISIQPTLIFHNALPYSLNVLLWQVGTSEDRFIPTGGEEHTEDSFLPDILSPRASMAVKLQAGSSDKGQYFAFQVPAGEKISVFADVRRDILLHTSIEEVNMRTIKWSLCNPARLGRLEFKDRTSKMSKTVALRMLDVGVGLPTNAFGVERYLTALKDGVSQLRSVQAQLKKDARKAVTARDVRLSVAKLRAYAKKKSRKRTLSSSRSAPPQTTRRATATSARPIPARATSIPGASPYHNLKPNGASGVKKKRLDALKRMIGAGSSRQSNVKSLEMVADKTQAADHDDDSEVLIGTDEITGAPEYTSRRPPPLEVDLEVESSESSSADLDQKNILAPPFLNVSIHNSLVHKDSGSVSRLTFYVPYWLNNRTGVDLFFKDAEAASHPLGLALPWEYSEVFAPGTSLTGDLDVKSKDKSFDTAEVLETPGSSYKVVLMNQHEDLALGLAHVSNRRYSQPVGVKTVGNKGTIELKGPVSRYQNIVGGSSEQSRADLNPQLRTVDEHANEGEISPIDEEISIEGSSIDLRGGAQAALGAMKALEGSARVSNADDDVEGLHEMDEKYRSLRKERKHLQLRSFEFAVDVSAAPRNSIFRNTKLINLKPKYIIENQTGILIDVKQIGTADPVPAAENSVEEGHRRFARTLEHGSRAAVYWDDADLPKEIQIRPRLEDEKPDCWNWSGSFPIPDTEWYFGLRVRTKISKSDSIEYHDTNRRRFINIPVNVTVGSSGSVQVTLKSPFSVPPYRIENFCKDVKLVFAQVPLVYRSDGEQYVDFLDPKEVMPYAWDEPTALAKLRVQAKIRGRQEYQVADFSLDDLGDAPIMLLPTQEGKEEKTTKTLYRTLSNEMPDELKQKLVSLLAAEFSKKVYVSVYADGPTRVLRFSDDKSVFSTDQKRDILDLAYRLKQIENELTDVNRQFARLSGVQGHQYFAALDLFGRLQENHQVDSELNQEQNLRGKSSRKIPMSEVAKQIVKQASRQVLQTNFSGENPEISTEEEDDDDDGLSIQDKNQVSVRFEDDARTPVAASQSLGTIHTFTESGLSTDEYERDRLSGYIFESSKKGSRDWGHLETADSAPRRGARRQATFHASAGKIDTNRKQKLLKDILIGDANLLVGGDLNITVVQAQNLTGAQRNTHAFARVRVRDAVPPPEDDERAKQTSVIWQSVDPIWDEQVIFKDVCVASELVVELWDLGGTRSSKQLKALSLDPAEVIKTCRFLGRAEVPLTESLDAPALTPVWYPLMRRTASDEISGRVQLRFQWDVTTQGLLSIRMLALESVLAQRREILAALQPVQSVESIAWSKPNPDTFASVDEDDELYGRDLSRQVMPTLGQEMFRLRREDFNTVNFNPSQAGIAVLNRHAHERRQSHLVVTILEARGLNPRSGVVVALSDNELPNPVVTIKLPGYPNYSTFVASHTLNPRWPANQRHIFRGVDREKAELTIVLSDQRNGIRRRARPLGRGMVHASNLKGDRPTYIWVPVYPFSKKNASIDTVNDTIPDLQVFLRLQWQRKVDRGSSIRAEMDLAGAGMMVVGGLQDELFNFTIEKMMIKTTITSQEKLIEGYINRLQLDNQTLNAGEPVVLAPDVGLRPTQDERPLVQFSLVQNFGASASNLGKSDQEVTTIQGCPIIAGKIADAGLSVKETADIRSFKKFSLTIDPLHLQTDEIFMESLLSFISSLPTADVWQEQAWQDQQYRLLSAQFGPREVEALAINANTAPKRLKSSSNEDANSGTRYNELALFWVKEKETKDIQALHGQSHLSSWFFIESAEISKIRINVSISLSSKVLSAGQSLTESDASDEFSRALGASGFQLVNVSNVEISFGKWGIGSYSAFKGKKTSNGFLSQRALINNLSRHYTRESLKEAHKVLGGSGPAVASVPLAVLWASGSAVVLLHEVSMGRAGPLGVAQQLVYLPVMTVSMFLSGFSRMFAAGMALVPPSRPKGDDETVRRLVKRPTNALDALVSMPREFFLGFTSAGQGILYDPIAGWHSGNLPGLVLGLAKGIVGLPVRPMIGIFEASSALTGAIAMTSLGREGIVGKTLQRVKAPGAFLEETIEGVDYAELEESPAVALQAAWNRVLPEFFPEMEGEEVKQVMNVRPTRVILITTNHVAYLKARHHIDHSVYKAKWVVPSFEIQNIQGDAETRKISVIHVRKFDLKVFGVWPVQMRKALRCENRSVFDRAVLKLTKVQQAAQAGRPLDEGGLKFITPRVKDLTVFNNPYKMPTTKIEEL